MVFLANVTTEDSIMNTRDFYPKNISIHGFQLGALLASQKWDAASAISMLLAMVKAQELRPIIQKTFDLSRPSEAHSYLERRSTVGKVLLTTKENL